jgi:hypothetical protein
MQQRCLWQHHYIPLLILKLQRVYEGMCFHHICLKLASMLQMMKCDYRSKMCYSVCCVKQITKNNHMEKKIGKGKVGIGENMC